MKILKLLLSTFILITTQNLHAQTFNIYVSDANNFAPPNKILKYDQNGENPETFIDENLNWPQDILFLEDQGVVLVSNLNSGQINRYNATTGDYIDNFAIVTGGPTRMEIGPAPDNHIYVLQWGGTGTVLRYQQDGTPLGEFTSTQVAQSIGLDWDTDGNLYVSSYGNSTIRKFDTNGNDLNLFISSGLSGPTNIKFTENGDLIVLNWNSGVIARFDSDGNLIENIDTGILQCEGFSFYPDGSFLIGHGANSSVRLYDSNFNYVENIVPSGSGGLIRPNAVILRDTSLSLENLQSFKETKIFENSIGNTFKINPLLINRVKTIDIFNLNGKLIYSTQLNQKHYWSSNNLSDGIYIVKTQFNNSNITQKITVSSN